MDVAKQMELKESVINYSPFVLQHP
ncbi:hypothetical protein ACUOFC_08700 [Escherichia sp. TWPC-MK]